jgi:hypothetical protein
LVYHENHSERALCTRSPVVNEVVPEGVFSDLGVPLLTHLGWSVLSRHGRVQLDPYPTASILQVGDGVPLDALSDGVNGGAEILGGLLNANTPSGQMSCGVLSHEDILDH